MYCEMEQQSSGTDNVLRNGAAVLLAINVLARPLADNEPIPRETMEALKKLLAEAGPEEIKIILGWIFNTRKLLISLPGSKAIAWTNEIDEILQLGKASAKD